MQQKALFRRLAPANCRRMQQNCLRNLHNVGREKFELLLDQSIRDTFHVFFNNFTHLLCQILKKYFIVILRRRSNFQQRPTHFSFRIERVDVNTERKNMMMVFMTKIYASKTRIFQNLDFYTLKGINMKIFSPNQYKIFCLRQLLVIHIHSKIQLYVKKCSFSDRTKQELSLLQKHEYEGNFVKTGNISTMRIKL